MTNTISKLIILGSGPAGLTAGIYAARANLKPIIIDGKQPGGQLMTTSTVDNWPGTPGILGPKLMQGLREHAQAIGCVFQSGEITKVNFLEYPFTLWNHRQEIFKSHAIIIATGALPKRLGCPGEDEYWAKGVTTCAVCDGPFYKNKPVIIVGGGDTAMEDASFMLNHTNDITIIQNSDRLTASAAMQARVLNKPTVNIIYNSTVSAIHGNGSHLTEVTITNVATQESYTRKAAALFVAIGINPNTQLFVNQLELLPNGYLSIKDYTKTSIKGVFAAGDVADMRYRQAITASGAGCMAALDAEKFLNT